jgi:hypothetical protein
MVPSRHRLTDRPELQEALVRGDLRVMMRRVAHDLPAVPAWVLRVERLAKLVHLVHRRGLSARAAAREVGMSRHTATRLLRWAEKGARGFFRISS